MFLRKMDFERNFHSEHIGRAYGDLFPTRWAYRRCDCVCNCIRIWSVQNCVLSSSERKVKAWSESASSDLSMIELWPSKHSCQRSREGPHSVFAGLVLVTYRGIVLLLTGYQADKTQIHTAPLFGHH
ncbi:hypothetical protein PM082_001830 [Marasmius tenuissimus]|nr:hypothetical protein PM082_001830 [Marasmius tenuissimus]